MLRFDNNNSIHNNINNATAKAVAFPWLRKKASSWSLRSSTKNIRLNSFSSTVSLPLSVTSTTFSATSSSIEVEEEETIPEENEEEQDEQDDKDYKDTPPCYDDPCHPWIFKFPKSLSNRIIIPREEEGHEELPDYDCTIDKMSYLNVKCEFIKPEVRSKYRSWRDLYIIVYGTKITAYHRNPKAKKTNPPTPVWSYSMQGAQVTVASDYVKFRHVLRLNIHNGPQFLMTAQNDAAKCEWMGVLESSIYISSDLDVRMMPQFITLMSRRRRNRQRRLAEQWTTQTETLV